MIINSSSKRRTRRTSWYLNRAKMNLDFDLNYPPAEAAPAQSSQNSPSLLPPTQQAAEGGGGAAGEAPIDIEASDDELQLLSSQRWFQQVGNQSRRTNRSSIVVVDGERETHMVTPEVRVDGPADPVTMSSINRANKRQRLPSNRPIINCENYSISEDDPIAKRTKSGKEVPGRAVPPLLPKPKMRALRCPICMGTLATPCATVCGHIFCEGCIEAALQVKKICPTCRMKLTVKKKFHRVFLPNITDGS